jgi:hypothetical protein
LLALVAAALIVVVGTASAIGGVRDFFLDRGFIGLPPQGATPSAPESGELLVDWTGFSATLHQAAPAHQRTVRAWVYADGRIIWDRRAFHGATSAEPIVAGGANALTSGYLEQRLTPEGVELMRSAAAELLDRNATLFETIPADVDPWWGFRDGRFALFVPNGYGSGWGVVVVRDGDRLARLRWQTINSKGDLPLEGPLATPEQLSALRRVDALLTDPASVLPSSAWAERKVRAYVPSQYAVCIETSPPKDASDLLVLLPARAAELLRDKSSTRRYGELFGSREPDGPMGVLGRSDRHCFKLETDEAREVADAVSGLDPEPGWESFGLAYRLAEGVHWWEGTTLRFEPFLPHGQIPFSGPAG